MKTNVKKKFVTGIIFITLFVLWTALIQIIDVQPVGQNGTKIGKKVEILSISMKGFI
jgi:undecaprenyl-diphosphatase